MGGKEAVSGRRSAGTAVCETALAGVFLAGILFVDFVAQEIRGGGRIRKRSCCNDGTGVDLRSGSVSALPGVFAERGDRRRIHSDGERSAAAVVFPAVFQNAVCSDAAGPPVELVVLLEEPGEMVVAGAWADGDGGFDSDDSIWMADGRGGAAAGDAVCSDEHFLGRGEVAGDGEDGGGGFRIDELADAAVDRFAHPAANGNLFLEQLAVVRVVLLREASAGGECRGGCRLTITRNCNKIEKCVATKGLTDAIFGCVASKGLTGGFFGCVAMIGLTGCFSWSEGMGEFGRCAESGVQNTKQI